MSMTMTRATATTCEAIAVDQLSYAFTTYKSNLRTAK